MQLEPQSCKYLVGIYKYCLSSTFFVVVAELLEEEEGIKERGREERQIGPVIPILSSSAQTDLSGYSFKLVSFRDSQTSLIYRNICAKNLQYVRTILTIFCHFCGENSFLEEFFLNLPNIRRHQT